jgi:hypothetical protein
MFVARLPDAEAARMSKTSGIELFPTPLAPIRTFREVRRGYARRRQRGGDRQAVVKSATVPIGPIVMRPRAFRSFNSIGGCSTADNSESGRRDRQSRSRNQFVSPPVPSRLPMTTLSGFTAMVIGK